MVSRKPASEPRFRKSGLEIVCGGLKTPKGLGFFFSMNRLSGEVSVSLSRTGESQLGCEIMRLSAIRHGLVPKKSPIVFYATTYPPNGGQLQSPERYVRSVSDSR